jgi:hypothetical protein
MKHDPVKRPAHYCFLEAALEVRDVINDRLYQFSLNKNFDPYEIYDYSNAIKYLLRWPFKNGLEDLKKASECINQLISMEEEKTQEGEIRNKKSSYEEQLEDMFRLYKD